MKITRSIATGAAAALLAGSVGAAPVAAQSDDGVGTATAAGSILSVDIGDLLGVTLFGDTGSTSNDDAGNRLSKNLFSMLSARSSLLDAVDGQQFGALSTSATDGEDTASESILAFSDLVAGTPLAGLLTGSVAPTDLLSSLVGFDGSSAVDAALVDFGLLGSLVGVDAVENVLDALTSVTQTSADRSASIDALSVLDLGGLLDLLGIDLLGLDLPVVGDLLGTLGGTVGTEGFPALGDITDGAGLESLVTTVDGVLTAVADPIQDMVEVIGGIGCTLTETIDPVLGALLGGFGLGATVGDVLDTLNAQLAPLGITVSCDLSAVNGLIDLIQSTLVGILTTVADTVGGASLLDVEGLTASVSSLATGSVSSSSADATGSIDDFSVAGVSIPGVAVEDTVEQLQGTVSSITGALDQVLAPLTALVGVDQTIGDLLTVELFDSATSVTEADGVVQSLAGIDVLSLGIAPPAILGDLLSAVSAIAPTDTLGAAITGSGGSLPVVGGLTDAILGATGAVEAFTADGIQVDVLSLASSANHATTTPAAPASPPAPDTTGELASTGGDTAPILVLVALGALGVAVLGRRFVTS